MSMPSSSILMVSSDSCMEEVWQVGVACGCGTTIRPQYLVQYALQRWYLVHFWDVVLITALW